MRPATTARKQGQQGSGDLLPSNEGNSVWSSFGDHVRADIVPEERLPEGSLDDCMGT